MMQAVIDWIQENPENGEPQCKFCQGTLQEHREEWSWIIRHNHNIGRSCRIFGPRKCVHIYYFELWEFQDEYYATLDTAQGYTTLDLTEMAQCRIDKETIIKLPNAPPWEKNHTTSKSTAPNPAPVIAKTKKNSEKEKTADDLYKQFMKPEVLQRLAKWQIWHVQSLLTTERKRRYPRNRQAKYGNTNRGFTQEELDRFLPAVKNDKARFAFTVMSNLGLRVGEVVDMRLEDIDFKNSIIRIRTEKAKTNDLMPLHDSIKATIQEWVTAHREEITAHNGYLIWGKKNGLIPERLRASFRDALARTELNTSYGKANPGKGGTQRKLHRLTTHSLRHYFITRVYKVTKDPVVAQRLARHKSQKSTGVYIFVGGDQLDAAVRAAFPTSA